MTESLQSIPNCSPLLAISSENILKVVDRFCRASLLKSASMYHRMYALSDDNEARAWLWVGCCSGGLGGGKMIIDCVAIRCLSPLIAGCAEDRPFGEIRFGGKRIRHLRHTEKGLAIVLLLLLSAERRSRR